MSLMARLGASADEVKAAVRKLFVAGRMPWDPATPTAEAVELLREAARQGDGEVLRVVVEERGTDAMVWAASAGEMEVLEALIGAGASVKCEKAKGEEYPKHPPLYAAAAAGQVRAVERLLAAGASPNDHIPHNPPLHAAAAAGSVEVVQMLLAAGADPQSLGRTSGTAIHAAAEAGKAEVIPWLRAAGVGLDTFDGRTRTALMYAAEKGYEAAVRALLGVGASQAVTPPKVKDPIEAMMAQMARTTPLILAAQGGHAGVVKLLFTARADRLATDAGNKMAVEYAIKAGHKEVVELLGGEPTELIVQRRLWEAAAAGDVEGIRLALKDGAKVDACAERGSAEKTAGRNALMLAVQGGRAEAVRELISAGAKLDERDGTEEGWTAVHYAVANSDAAMLELLVQAGAKLTVEKRMMTSSATALHLAAKRGDVAMVKALLAYGADPLAESAGDVPLQIAAEQGQVEAVKVLATAEARPVRRALLRALRKWQPGAAKALLAMRPSLARTKDGQSSPIAAALLGYCLSENRPPVAVLVELLRELLEAGADPKENGEFQRPPGLLATEYPEALKMLIAAGIDVNAADLSGETPLMCAAGLGHADAVRILLDAGADLTRVDRRGKSCMDRAVKHPQVVEILRAAGALPGEELAAGKVIAEAKGKERLKRERKEAEQRRADAAIRPDFSKKVKSKAFATAKKRLEELAGRPGQALDDVPGLVYCEVETGRCEEMVEKHREEFLKAGCYLFQLDLFVMPQTGHSAVAILSTKKPLEVVAALGISAPNVDKGVADIVEGLEKVGKITPYVIEKIGHDTIVGRFTKKITAAKKLAEAIYELCPDVVDQGTESVEALAEELKKTGRLFLWWD